MVLDLVGHLLQEIWDHMIMAAVACIQIMDAEGAAA